MTIKLIVPDDVVGGRVIDLLKRSSDWICTLAKASRMELHRICDLAAAGGFEILKPPTYSTDSVASVVPDTPTKSAPSRRIASWKRSGVQFEDKPPVNRGAVAE
jgi:hypothetical protein